MNKLLVALLLFLSCLPAQAREIAGMKLDEQVQVSEQKLVLNGAGLRSIFFIKMYVAGLYLDEKTNSAATVFAGKGVKRIAIHVVADEIDSEHFLKGFRNGMEKNSNEQQLALLRERMQSFERSFEAIKLVKKGDVITFDWQAGGNLGIASNGNRLGEIAGEDFCRALFSIWIGDKPATADLKKELLGG